MMLAKRSRAVRKDQSLGQLMADSNSDWKPSGSPAAVTPKTRGASFFSVPGLFIGFDSKFQSDCDHAKSPTSPLDSKAFSNLGKQPLVGSWSGIGSSRKSWEFSKVGLGLLDSLTDEANLPVESKRVIFGSKMRINVPTPKASWDRTTVGASASLPENHLISLQACPGSPCFRVWSSRPGLVIGPQSEEPKEMGKKTQSCSAHIGGRITPLTPTGKLVPLNPKPNSEALSFESRKLQLDPTMAVTGVSLGNHLDSLSVSFDSLHGFVGSLSASDIENSEDYTRIISRGANPKTTHIFGDCILESRASELSGSTDDDRKKVAVAVLSCEEPSSSWLPKRSDDPEPSPAENFPSFCYSWKKKLIDGEDIYMYRGEKAFCSYNCREQEMMMVNDESDD